MLCRMTALRQGRLRNARSEHRCENLCRLFNKHPKSRGQKTRSQKFVKEFFFLCLFGTYVRHYACISCAVLGMLARPDPADLCEILRKQRGLAMVAQLYGALDWFRIQSHLSFV